jgi:ribose transport system substrate-binding protein
MKMSDCFMGLHKLPWSLPALALLMLGPVACDRPSDNDKAILWIQPMRDHPVAKIMQTGFLARCVTLGYRCVVVGNPSATRYDVSATIPLADAALAQHKYGAVAVFALDPSLRPYIARLARDGYPVVTWHVIPKKGEIVGLRAAVAQNAVLAAEAVAEALGSKLNGRGVIAVTQGSFNAEENQDARIFKAAVAAHFPDIKVLDPELEGFEPSSAKAKAEAMLQADPKIDGVFSTTGNGVQTWAGAARATTRQLIIIGKDYIRQNLDLIRDGEVYGVLAQPLYEEGAKTADLAADLASGKSVPFATELPAEVITKADLARYYKILNETGL